MKKRANWQLPTGVSSGTWDYSRSDQIATDYDRYFARHGMFTLDQSVLQHYFSAGKSVVDLGCGTGRAILPLIESGMEGVAVDLSDKMLAEVRRKADDLVLDVDCVRANLVDLSCFAEHSFDYAICLFSTLGMIRSHAARERVMEGISRIVKPGGLFVFQVHNYWVHLFDPEGPWWMIRNLTRTFVKRDVEIGDKFYLYRGIPDMYLHSFTRRELRSMLRGHGFRSIEWLPLNASQSGRLKFPSLLGSLRASGWIVVAQR